MEECLVAGVSRVVSSVNMLDSMLVRLAFDRSLEKIEEL